MDEHSNVTAVEPPEPEEVRGISLPRFAWLLALGVLGLAGLLSLGVGGVSLVHVDISPSAPVQKSESVVTR